MSKEAIVAYCKNNTGIEIQDIFKYLYQSCMGCEHLVSDYDRALEWIKEEAKSASLDDLPEMELLDGDFCRLHLKVVEKGVSTETICRIFLDSSDTQVNGKQRLEGELNSLIELAEDGKIPFAKENVMDAVAVWKESGLQPIHHSEKFRDSHHPAYRVVKKSLIENIFDF